MKKRGLIFTGIFTLFLILLYMQPVWFPQTNEDTAGKQTKADPPATTLNYEPIQTAGFASWIGQDLKEFEKVYGQPTATFPSGFDFTIQRFALSKGMLEVNSDKKVIRSIKYLGGLETSNIEPFHLGMTMDELAKITMVYPNFTLVEGSDKIGFELTEDDMNYRPLIAFDNGSFAILFFDQSKKQPTLYGIDYLDSRSLLKLAPYPVTSGKAPRFKQAAEADWEKIDAKKKEQTIDLLQLLRQKNRKAPFGFHSDLQVSAEQTLSRFLSHREDFLTTERMQLLQRVEKDEAGVFHLTNSEVKNLLKGTKFSDAGALLEVPVYDPTFTLLSWYSNETLYKQLWGIRQGSLSIAFSKESMLVLLEKNEYQNKESESR